MLLAASVVGQWKWTTLIVFGVSKPAIETLYVASLLRKLPRGKPFEELYDVDRLTPTPAHQTVYDEVNAGLNRPGVSVT